jgi:2,5-diketo-D-gluconate reductase B
MLRVLWRRPFTALLTIGILLALPALRRGPHAASEEGSFVEDAWFPLASGSRYPMLFQGEGDQTLWVEAGGRALDTSWDYGPANHRKVAAAMDALPALGLARDDVYVTSKIVPKFDAYPNVPSVAEQVRQTLALSKAGYFDMLLMHWPGQSMRATLDAWREMEALVAAGLARELGVSNMNATTLATFHTLVATKPAVLQAGYAIGLHRKPQFGMDAATVDKCKQLGVLFQAYSVLGGWTLARTLEGAEIKAIAKSHGVHPAEVAMAWARQQGFAAVFQSSTKSHMVSALHSLQLQLTSAEMETLSDVPDACEQMAVNRCKVD